MNTSQDPFKQAWSEFSLRLSKKELEEFQFTSIDDVRVALRSMQDEQGRRRTMMHLPRVQAFLEAMEQYGKVIEVFLNTSSILCFVWGPMKFCLQVASSWADSFDILLDAYKQLGENLPLLQQYQTLFDDRPEMTNLLSLMYKDILDFHQAALRIFSRHTWKQIFKATWKNFKTRFQHILDDLKIHKALIESQANLLQIQDSQEERAKVRGSFAEIQETERKNRLLVVMNWLMSMDINDHVILDQETAMGMRQDYPSTGRWIFSEPKVKAWMDPSNAVLPILWMNGIPGAGKTILASLIIEESLKMDEKSTIFFYCKYQDDRKKTFLGVARSLLSQLLNKHEDLLPYLYDQCITSGQVSLVSSQLATELLKTCLETVPKASIIIDGIDECDFGERKAILLFFTSVIERSVVPGELRGLFVSQDENDIRRLLRTASVLRLTDSHNKSDIESYATHWLGKITQKFGIPIITQKYIKETVCSRSEGMFLFAKLVLTNFHDQTSLEDLIIELQPGTFPSGFEKAYSRIVVRVFNNPNKRERETAQKLLGWIVSAKRPLKWHEIQGAVSIDLEDHSVDFKFRQLRTHIRDLCGSLIEVLPGDRVQLVHETAKVYLFQTSHLKVLVEEHRLSVLCLKYLTFEYFDPDISDESMEKHFMDGAYAFQEYAVLHWLDHLEAIIQCEPLSEFDNSHDLGSAVNDFYDTYGAGNSDKEDVPAELRERCHNIRDGEYAENMLLLISHARKSRSSHDQLVALGDLGSIVDRTRSILEKFSHSTVLSAESKDKLQQYYGINWHKCPRHNCFYFHEGFQDALRRENHVSRHERPFCCTELSCPRINLGFSTEKELKKHMAIQHPDPAAFAWRFPKVKKADPKHCCTLCPKEFKRAHSLKIHMRAHGNERPFKCRFCTKLFDRKDSCERHEEKLHPEQKDQREVHLRQQLPPQCQAVRL